MSKKLATLIVAACLVVGGSLALAVWAIAATNVGLGATVSVTYTASPNVVCDITATYQKKNDSDAIPFESGGVSMQYSSAGGTRNMIASSQAISLNDSDTFVVFEYKFTNNNKMNTMGITIQPVDNGSVTGGITRKYYFGDLTSRNISNKQKAILNSGVENASLSGYSRTISQNETICFYMLLQVTQGLSGKYIANNSQIFTFTLTAVEVDPPKISYLSSDWTTRLFSTDAEANAVQSIVFTKDSSKISGLANSISLGTNSVTSTDSFTQAEGFDDVKAYYNDKTNIVIYSSGKIYAPQDSSYLFCRGRGSGVFKALTSLDLSNFDTRNTTTMSNMFYSCVALTSIDLTNFNTSKTTDMNSMFEDCTSLVSLDLSNFNTSNVTTMAKMFFYCMALTSLDASNFNTSKVTNMSYMFYSCMALTSLDISNFDTINVIDMTYMFSGCSSLISLDLSNFNTRAVNSMSWMFYNCKALVSLNIGDFNNSALYNMSHMFSGCKSLSRLYLSSFNTSNVSEMSGVFEECSSLIDLDLSNFNTSKVENMNSMFFECSSLTSLDVSNFNTSKVYSMMSMFGVCSALTTLDLGNFNLQSCTAIDAIFQGCTSLEEITLPYNLQSGKTIVLPGSTFYNGNAGPYSRIGTATNGTTVACSTASSKVTLSDESIVSYLSSDWTTRLFSTDAEANAVQSIVFTKDSSKISGLANSLSLGTISPTSTAAYTSTTGVKDVKAYYNDKTNIVIYSHRTIYAPQDSSYLFCRGNASSGALKALTTLDLSNFDTSNVTKMLSMFYSCSTLTSFDLSNFDTSNVTDMSNMFYYCSALTNLNVSNFNTSNVTNMFGMFRGCLSLNSLDVSNFDSSKVTDMAFMFYSCEALSDLNVDAFITSNVTDMQSMFGYLKSLTTLNLMSFDTSNVTDMNSMFFYCSSLIGVEFGNYFNTSNVTDMSAMFCLCSSLMSIDVGTFNTSKVKYMSNMFSYCSALTTLNLGNFNLQSCTDFTTMLSYCSSLEQITLPYNLQSGYTIDLPSVTGAYTWGTDISPGNYTAYTKIGTTTDTSNGIIACSSAIKPVILYKAERSGTPDV